MHTWFSTHIILQLNGSPKKKSIGKAIQKPPGGPWADSSAGESETEQKLRAKSKNTTKIHAPLINVARRDQGLVLLRRSGCFPEYQRQTIYKGWLGPQGKLYLACLLPRVLNHVQLLSDSTKGRNVHTRNWIKKCLWRWPGGNVRQLLEMCKCATSELQHTVLLLLGTAAATLTASLIDPVECTPRVRQCSSHCICIIHSFSPPNKPIKHILLPSSPVYRWENWGTKKKEPCQVATTS